MSASTQEEPAAPDGESGGNREKDVGPGGAAEEQEGERGEDADGGDDNGDIRITQKEVPSAVFGSAKEALAKEKAAAAAGKGKGGGMGALQRLKVAGGGGGGLGSK